MLGSERPLLETVARRQTSGMKARADGLVLEIKTEKADAFQSRALSQETTLEIAVAESQNLLA